MDLIVALALLVLCYIPISISNARFSKGLFALVPFIIGLFVAQEGIVYGSTVISSVGTNINLVFVAFLTLGSVVSIYDLATGEKIARR